VIEVFPRPHKSLPAQIVGLLIRARAELFLITVAVVVIVGLLHRVPTVQDDLVVLGAVVVVFVVPHSRRFVIGRLWCVLDRHRLHTCLRQTKIRTMNMDGSLPFLLWARPTKTGERIWLWVRAGSSGGDVEDALEYIAPACYARDARIHRVRQLTTLVAVEIIRRDPLAKPSPIPSPLARLTSRFLGATTEGTDPIRPATVTDISTAAHAGAPVVSPRPVPRKSAPAASVPGTAVIVNGEDVSDYVD
jgi:hypothetical protein